MSMTHGIDKGQTGAKRSSWQKLHFRDLGLKICEEHPDATVESLADIFVEQLDKYPEYLESIAIYIMANVRASLLQHAAPRRQERNTETTVLNSIAKKVAARALMELELPNGKLLRESTGTECIKAGGWLKKIGEAVGPTGIVGQKLTEAKLRNLLQGAAKKT